MTALDQLPHLAEEEGEQQGANVGTVHIRIRHDDDAVVAQLFNVELRLADATAQGGDDVGDFLRGQHPVTLGLLDIEDLSLQRKNGLGLARSEERRVVKEWRSGYSRMRI